MTEADLSTFKKKLAEKRAREAAAAAPVTPDHAEDLVPDAGYERSEEDQALDDVIRRIDIIDGYRRWCGKMVPEVRAGQTEGIKISCPIPGHRDSNPSAWINTEKQTWFCATCATGGDVLDIAAFHFNYPVPGYKDGARFHELRRDMAKSMGYTFVKPPGAKAPIPVAPTEDREAPQEEPTGKSAPSVTATVTELHPGSDDDDLQIEFPTLDWRGIVEPGTFLDTYMGVCTQDDVPEEYHFWNGLVALGLAVGRDVTLFDFIPVYGNLFVCLLGNTGDGKSRSFSHLKKLLTTALPHKWDDPGSKGIVQAASAASAEVLIHSFSKPIPDPANPKVVAYHAPVRGLIEFNELSALIGRTQRQGNLLKPTMMEFYDAVPEVSTMSMTGGKKIASQPFGSAFTTTQPRALKELISKTDTDSGFLNRWVFASGRQKQRVAIGGHSVDIKPAIEPLQKIHAWPGFGKYIQWSPEAAAHFTDIFHTVLQPAKERDDGGFLTRIDLLIKKLILLFCINEMLDEVPERIVEKAFKMYPYLVSAYAIPAGQIGNTVYYEVIEEIRKHIRTISEKNKNGATMRELNQRLQRKKYPPRIIKDMLEYMVNTSGEIEIHVTKGARGPETTRYRFVG